MPLFGVLDCAVADWVYPAVQAEGANRSLFSGALDPDLVTATPHLVELRPDSPLLARMNGAEARAAHCGILCESDLSLWDLRLWLRRHLQAMLPDGRVTLFRFFDPRVLPIWLASLTPEDLGLWFGPVSQWWVPLPDRTLTLTRDASGLVQMAQPLSTPVT